MHHLIHTQLAHALSDELAVKAKRSDRETTHRAAHERQRDRVRQSLLLRPDHFRDDTFGA